MNHGRILAALAGVAFLGGSLTIILGQALLTPSTWGQYQVLTVLMILGTIAAGHLAKTAFKARFVASALGFCVLFVAGSALVVYNSVGRQAETHDTIAMERAAANGLIEDKTRDIEEARERERTARANADRERGSKCKTKCKDWEAAANDARKLIAVLESEVRALGAPRPVDAKASKAGEVAAAFGYERHKVEVLAALLEPFFWTVFFELGSVISLGFAFRPFPVSTVSKPIAGSGNSGGGKAERAQIRLVEDHEVAALKKALQGRGSVTNDELADLMGVAKGEASKRVSKALELGIVSKRRTGRHVAISMHAH